MVRGSFDQSLELLAADRRNRWPITLAIAGALVAGWIVWFVAARIPIRVSSERARLETEDAIYAIQAVTSGRVVALHLTGGEAVTAGDILVELDAETQKKELAEASSVLAGVSRRRDAVLRQIAAENDLRQIDDAHGQSSVDERTATVQSAKAALEQARSEQTRTEDLHKLGLVSDVDLTRAKTTVAQRASELESIEATVRGATTDQQGKSAQHRAELQNLNRTLAELEATFDSETARVGMLEHAIENCRIRAPASGRIAEASNLRVGAVLQPGDSIATVAAAGQLGVTADFAPSSAFGRVHEGQPAVVRLDGFPSTRYGALTATVARVAGEPRDGLVRVNLALAAAQSDAIPLQHGLPASVEIEVDRPSPLGFVLNATGETLLRSRSRPAAAR